MAKNNEIKPTQINTSWYVNVPSFLVGQIQDHLNEDFKNLFFKPELIKYNGCISIKYTLVSTKKLHPEALKKPYSKDLHLRKSNEPWDPNLRGEKPC